MKPSFKLLLSIYLAVDALNASALPTIPIQPKDKSASLGAIVKLQLFASGIAPLSYKWLQNSNEIAGATGNSLTFSNLQSISAGDYVAVVTDVSGSVTSRVAKLQVDTTFIKITAGPIATQGSASIACAWGDYNNDGLIDLYVNNRDARNFLYRNKGGGEFEKVMDGHLVTDTTTHLAGIWADYDNDGFLDMLVVNGGSAAGAQRNLLYHNNGDGTFTQPSAEAVGSIVTDAGGFHGAAWGDYDGDGLLDVFVANSTGNNYLYHALVGGGFERLETFGSFCGGAVWVDYDHDGDLDLFILTHLNSGDLRKNLLYRNDGYGLLTQITTGPIVSEVFQGWGGGVAWGDYNNDGYVDLFVSNFPAGRDLFYRNLGDGNFSKITNSPLVNENADTNGAVWGDYDNDGFLDLFVANGFFGDGGLDNYLFHNKGDGSFEKILTGSLANDQGHSIACAWSDYNNDGFLDLFVANDPTFDEVSEFNFLYRSNPNANNWLKVRCVGTVSNRGGIGALVRVKANYAGQDRWQMRQIASSEGRIGGSLEAHFGLGDATTIGTLRIDWPSGIVQEMHNVPVKQFLTITEPARLQTTTLGAFAIKSWKGMAFDVQTSTNLMDWLPASTITNFTGALEFTDLNASVESQRFYRTALSK